MLLFDISRNGEPIYMHSELMPSNAMFADDKY